MIVLLVNAELILIFGKVKGIMVVLFRWIEQLFNILAPPLAQVMLCDVICGLSILVVPVKIPASIMVNTMLTDIINNLIGVFI